MATVRVMAVFQGRSGLPEDMFVNTFHMVGSQTYAEDLLLAREAVRNFYETATGGQSAAIGAYLSPRLFREWKIKTYDMASPKVRVPTVLDGTLPSPQTPDGPPEEVAVTLSYHGSAPPVSARRRGRIFLGPLCKAAATDATTSGPARVATVFSNDLAIAATKLVDTPLIQWSIGSVTPSENYVAIVGGYIDNALDTQRRRGAAPTTRTQWLATP